MKLQDHIRNIKDFPKKGVIFRDITPLFLNPQAMTETVDTIVSRVPVNTIDKVVGVEARGFFLAPMLANRLNAGFVPVRKKGKLPFDTLQETYDLEYGQDSLEIHKDAIQAGDLVLIHDDVLATGGTALATTKLIEQLGGRVVQLNFLLEILSLKGRAKLENYAIETLCQYE